uniref:(northern house mosquito) hypothetical protein n=1 Tax=Culex pipiens TaxID=7175 RepID=A0A8D8MND3_CULPI
MRCSEERASRWQTVGLSLRPRATRRPGRTARVCWRRSMCTKRTCSSRTTLRAPSRSPPSSWPCGKNTPTLAASFWPSSSGNAPSWPHSIQPNRSLTKTRPTTGAPSATDSARKALRSARLST